MTSDIPALVGRGHGHCDGIDVAAPGWLAEATPPTRSSQAPGLATLYPKIPENAHSLKSANSEPGGDS